MEMLDVTGISGKRILAIGAHPDDLEFSCGGTLLLLAEKNRIVAVSVTSGQMGSHDEDDNHGDIIAKREGEQRKASAMYNAAKTLLLQFPDMFVAEQFKRLKKRLIKLLVRERPQIVITHDPWTEYFPYHPDHRAIGYAVFDAVIASTLPLYLQKRAVAGKALHPRPQLWLMHPHEPTHVVDVTSVYERKIESIKVHESQFDDVVVWEEIRQKLEAYFAKVGKSIGVRYGEAFRIVEQ